MVNSKIQDRFISFEGLDGAGKSSHIQWLVDLLRSSGKKVTQTREPGGTPLAEKIRTMLLLDDMDVETEALLFTAARRDHLVKVIEPALARGDWVISDRFETSSYAYQSGGRGLPRDRLAMLDYWIEGLRPGTTFFFDLPATVAADRINQARELDRFEQEQQDFHNRVRDAYLHAAQSNPDRFVVINANQSIEQVRSDLEQSIQTRFGLSLPAVAA